MHITAKHIELLHTLELVARVSTKHLTLPALQCVLLEVKDGVLHLSATNLEVGVRGSVSVTEHKSGKVAVSATTLLQTLSLISQTDVTLKTEEQALVVETGGSKTVITTTSTEDFPSIPSVEGAMQEINGPVFATGIKTAAFAASQSSVKPELGSVYVFQQKEHSLTFVATDSFRLVEKTVPQQGVVLENPLLIPQKNALELAYICESEEKTPKLIVAENQCALEFENIYITSRLTTGSFPDYVQIIPKEFSTHTTLLTQDLQSALKKTSIFLNKFMQLTLNISRSGLTLVSKGDFGETSEYIKAETEGDDLTLSFNQRYIQDILPHITDDSATLHFAGIGRPMVIEGAHDRSLRYLVMPMNK